MKRQAIHIHSIETEDDIRYSHHDSDDCQYFHDDIEIIGDDRGKGIHRA